MIEKQKQNLLNGMKYLTPEWCLIQSSRFEELANSYRFRELGYRRMLEEPGISKSRRAELLRLAELQQAGCLEMREIAASYAHKATQKVSILDRCADANLAAAVRAVWRNRIGIAIVTVWIALVVALSSLTGCAGDVDRCEGVADGAGWCEGSELVVCEDGEPVKSDCARHAEPEAIDSAECLERETDAGISAACELCAVGWLGEGEVCVFVR